MKIFFIGSLIILSLSNILYSQSGWTVRYIGMNYKSVDVISGTSIAFLCGDERFVRKTSDYGATWHFYDVGYNEDLKGVNFADMFTGWIITDESKILKSINGGRNWSLNHIDTSSLACINFANTMTGFVGLHNKGILKTTDGGENWIHYSANFTFGVDNIYIYNSEVWAGGNFDTVMYSSNLGETWQKIPTGYQTLSNSPYFLNSSTGWIAGNNVLKTTNGGNSWTNQLTLSSFEHEVCFANSFVGYIYGGSTSNATVYYLTTTGGNNWEQYYTNDFGRLRGMDRAHQEFVVAGGDDGAVIKITSEWNWDYGYSIRKKGFRSIDFVNKDTGYIAYDDSTVVYTANGGKSWKWERTGQRLRIRDVRFIDNKTGYMSGEGLLITTNGARTWGYRHSPNYNYNWRMFFLNGDTGWALGTDTANMLYKTTQGGSNWMLQNLSTDEFCLNIYFVNNNLGFIGCNNGTMYRTSNGGLNWSKITTGAYHDIFSIKFLNENTGWATGYHGPIFKTTDGGLSWFSQIDPLYYHMFDINIINENDVWVMGSGKLVHTTNGGANWSIQSPPYNFEINTMYAFNDTTFFLAGGNSTILYTQTAGQSVGISSISSEIPSRFSLHQNYPNPFNPSTKIKFDITEASLVRLTVYDILGRQVAELVNQNMNVGSYEYEWSGAELSSGIYFYKLEAGEFIETKRMVLVK